MPIQYYLSRDLCARHAGSCDSNNLSRVTDANLNLSKVRLQNPRARLHSSFVHLRITRWEGSVCGLIWKILHLPTLWGELEGQRNESMVLIIAQTKRSSNKIEKRCMCVHPSALFVYPSRKRFPEESGSTSPTDNVLYS